MPASVYASAKLTPLCFPDITSATIGAYLQVTFNAGAYTTGGIPFGLINFADGVTVDFNGFLECDVRDESMSAGTAYTFRYVPSSDTLIVYSNGTELTNFAALAITDSVIAHAVWNRTTTLG